MQFAWAMTVLERGRQHWCQNIAAAATLIRLLGPRGAAPRRHSRRAPRTESRLCAGPGPAPGGALRAFVARHAAASRQRAPAAAGHDPAPGAPAAAFRALAAELLAEAAGALAAADALAEADVGVAMGAGKSEEEGEEEHARGAPPAPDAAPPPGGARRARLLRRGEPAPGRSGAAEGAGGALPAGPPAATEPAGARAAARALAARADPGYALSRDLCARWAGTRQLFVWI